MKMLFQSGVLCLEFRGILDVIKIDHIFVVVLYVHFSNIPNKRVHWTLICWWLSNSHGNCKNIMMGVIYESSQFNGNSQNTESIFYLNLEKFIF
jgi:hypothetical protein